MRVRRDTRDGQNMEARRGEKASTNDPSFCSLSWNTNGVSDGGGGDGVSQSPVQRYQRLFPRLQAASHDDHAVVKVQTEGIAIVLVNRRTRL